MELNLLTILCITALIVSSFANVFVFVSLFFRTYLHTAKRSSFATNISIAQKLYSAEWRKKNDLIFKRHKTAYSVILMPIFCFFFIQLKPTNRYLFQTNKYLRIFIYNCKAIFHLRSIYLTNHPKSHFHSYLVILLVCFLCTFFLIQFYFFTLSLSLRFLFLLY